MANRFWVLGSGDWSDDTNHWATSTGGLPGAGNLPTSTDDVFIDANSGFGGGGTITVNNHSYCKNFTSNTGNSYTIDVTNYVEIRFYGNLTLESGITVTTIQDAFTPRYTTGSFTIITNGCILPRFLIAQDGGDAVVTILDNSSFLGDFGVYGGSVTLNGNIITTGQFYHENGTFDANDHNVTANDFYFYADTGYTPTVIMGLGMWTPDRSSWILDENSGEVVTIIPPTSPLPIFRK